MKNIIQTIDQWGLDSPDRICYIEGQESYTFGELKRQSDLLAIELCKKSKSTQAVVVFGGLEFEMLVSFLACVKSGRAYIPIDSHTPVERIEMIIEIAKPEVILAVSQWPLQDVGDLFYNHEVLNQIILSESVEVLDENEQVGAEDNFYIIFTSGTTGVPKGVQITHSNLCSFVSWIVADFQIEEGQRFLSQAPYSFDLSVMDIYPALASGGSLVVLGKELVTDFKLLFSTLPEMQIEVWVSTPSFVDICLMDPHFSGEHLPDLSHFLFCGEELLHGTAEKLLERFPNAKVWNTYGPTETTVAVTEIEVTSQLLQQVSRLPIGKVKEDTQILIMDEEKVCTSEGQMGEIVIVGPSVSKGYLNNPEKTEAAFFEYEGQQAYRTGDAGVFKQNVLYYKGRMDFQVKFHGYRIELEDIDHHLSEVSLVKACAVVPKYANHKVQQLVAFVVPEPNDFAKEFQLSNAIKKELQESVMDYMIPQKYIYVEQLPLTQNGKVNRKGLINEVNPA